MGNVWFCLLHWSSAHKQRPEKQRFHWRRHLCYRVYLLYLLCRWWHLIMSEICSLHEGQPDGGKKSPNSWVWADPFGKQRRIFILSRIIKRSTTGIPMHYRKKWADHGDFGLKNRIRCRYWLLIELPRTRDLFSWPKEGFQN